jgi:hypothetical protein
VFSFHSALSGDLRCSEVTQVTDLEVRKRSVIPLDDLAQEPGLILREELQVGHIE